jgi:hypothetical protein
MPGPGRDAPVEGLTDLTDDDEAIDRSGAQRPEYILPRRGQGSRRAAKLLGNRPPGFYRTLKPNRSIAR